MGIRIGFTGDVMLGRNVNEIQKERPPEAIWGDILSEINNLDGLFINLECCISDRGSPWKKTPRAFHFRADPGWAIEALKKANVRWCNLANNHMMDYREEALLDTINYLKKGEIRHSGAGINRKEAFEPSVLDINNLKIAFISFSEDPKEYSADKEKPGIAYIDLDNFKEDILDILDRVEKKNPDIMVASGHLGPNMVEKPTDKIQKFVHFLIDNGVDIFHGHSAHIFQGVEVYKGSPILYDTGDFIDDYRVDPILKNNRSFLFKVVIDKNKITKIGFFPVKISEYSVQTVDENTKKWCFNRIKNLSKEFGTSFEKKDKELILKL